MITVQGNIITALGQPWEGRMAIMPCSTPIFTSGSFVATAPVYLATDDDGSFSTPIAPGEYDVECVVSRVARNPVRRFKIWIPPSVNGNGEATVDFEDTVKSAINLESYFGGLPNEGGTTAVAAYPSFYTDKTALAARTIHSDGHWAYLKYYETAGDGGGGPFGYNSESEADEDENTIKPTNVTGAGRWERL